MSSSMIRRLLLFISGAALFSAGWLVGLETGKTEKTVLHAVAWTPHENVTEQGFLQLREATGNLVGRIPGLQKAWVGKLAKPLIQGDETRTWGLVFEFDDLQSRQAYSKHPVRVEWGKLWSNTRAATTVFDVVGD